MTECNHVHCDREATKVIKYSEETVRQYCDEHWDRLRSLPGLEFDVIREIHDPD